MKKLAITLAALPALVPALLLTSASANASTGAPANGSFTATVGVTKIVHDGPNTIFFGPEVQQNTGALNGTRVAFGEMTVHADGSFEARDKGVFTGTVDGRSGTVEIDGESTGVGNSGSGQIVFSHGTGGLAGLHGVGTFTFTFPSPTTTAGTYSVQVHFSS